MVVLVLSLVFIFSVVALHSKSFASKSLAMTVLTASSYRQGHPTILELKGSCVVQSGNWGGAFAFERNG